MLDLVEEALNQVAFLINVLVVRDGLRTGCNRGNHGRCADLGNASTKAICIVAFIGQEMFKRNPADQVLGLKDIVHLTTGQDEANGVAKRIHARTDLGAQAAARTPDRLAFAPPFAPAAC